MPPSFPHPILETLQESLRAEHASIVQMMSHAIRIHDLQSLHAIEGIARQDMRHFKWLAEMVVKLGGNPTLERGAVFLEPASPLIWITSDVALTEDAIARYRMAADATQAEPQLNRLFERLLADEEDHRAKLMELVDYWREKPEPVAPLELDHLAEHSEDGRIHGFLDFAIQHEYAVILQYLHHSFLIEDQKVSRDMEEIAVEEMRHLGWLSEKLVERKGCPMWEVDRLEHHDDPIQMLELDLAREIEVEADYQEFTAAMTDPEIKALFDRIGQHETYHAGVIGEMIARLKAAREAEAPVAPPVVIPQAPAAQAPVPRTCPTVGSLLGRPQV